MRAVSECDDHSGLIRRRRSWLVPLLIWMTSLASVSLANTQAGGTSTDNFVSSKVIVIGFVGGFVRPDDERHLEVQMIERLAKEGPGVRAEVFENRHTDKAC